MDTASADRTVALVVPVYNMEEHLAECLASIEAQTVFREMQVVLVDDGSVDASPDIAAAFAARHDNVVLLREPNRGPGAARNRGLREVTAPFVTFCDSDDRLPPDGVETLRRILLEHDADVAVGALEAFPRQRTWPWFEHLDSESRLVPGIEHARGLVHSAGPCDKLFRTEMLQRLGVSFAVGTHFEDAYVAVPVLLAADRIAVTRKVVYHYRLRSGSIMRSLWSRADNFWDHLALQEFLGRLRPRLPAARREVLDLFMVRSFQGFAMRAPEVLDGPDLRAYYDRCAKVFAAMAPHVIAEAGVGTRHRVAFVAFLVGDQALFADRRSRITGLDVAGGHLHLRLREDLPDPLRALLRVDRTYVLLESLDALDGGATLRLRGRMSFDGLAMTGLPSLDVAVEVDGCGPARRARVTGRPWPPTVANPNDWYEFTAELPTAEFVDGLHQVRLVVGTADGTVDLAVSPATGALRAARVQAVGRHRLLLLRTGTGVSLRVAGPGLLSRARFATGLLLADARHVRRREPLWRARLARLVTAPLVRSNIWLLAEKRHGGPDNATALFRHLREHRPDIRAYYVANRDDEVAELEGLGRVVARGSRRHRALMLHAAVLAAAHDVDDCLLPAQWPKGQYLQHLAWRVGSRRVFLQHGIGYDPADAAWHRGTAGADLFLASSAPEVEVVLGQLGYTRRQVVLTGLTRLDALDRPPDGRRILVVPGTGAGDLAEPVAAFWRAVLHDQSLLQLLERSGTTLEVLTGEPSDDLASSAPVHPRVVVSDAGVRPSRDAVLDCSLLLTDRSALALDAAHAGRAVLIAALGPPPSLGELAGAGAVVRTPAELVAAARRHVDSGEQIPVAPGGRGACARVVAAVEALLAGGRARPAVPSSAEPPERPVPPYTA